MPPNPPPLPRVFFILKMLQNNSAGKTVLENMSKFGGPSLKNFLDYVTDMRTFFKGLFFTSFLGLTSLYWNLVSIQPKLKFHPPPAKFSGSAPECEIKVLF